LIDREIEGRARRRSGEGKGRGGWKEESGGRLTISLLCSLQFASRAMKVQNTPTVNEVCYKLPLVETEDQKLMMN